MGIGNNISHILANSSKLPQLFSGLSYFKNGGLSKSFSVIGMKGTHFDMRNCQETIYTGWSLSWWISAISLIITNILSIISNGFGISNILSIAFGAGISLVIFAWFMDMGKKNDSHWKAGLVKLLIILHLIGILGCLGVIFIEVIVGGIGSITSLIFLGIKDAIYFIINIFIELVVNILTIVASLYTLSGLNGAVVNANGGYNPYYNNSNMNNGYNPNMQNGYNPNQDMSNGFNNVVGLGAINTQKNQSIGEDTTGFTQQNGYSQQNNYGYNQNQQNTYNPNNEYIQQPQNVQMYACPYCGQAIVHMANPCPHCNNQINWGV